MENNNHSRTAPPLFIFYGNNMAAVDNLQKNDQEKNGRAAWWQPAIIMFLRLSAWIAAPVIIALFLGKWLDQKFNTAPWLFLALTSLAFLVSMGGLIKNTLEEYRKIEQASKTEKPKRN